MWKWAQQTLANVAGTEEPEYGPGAIQTVTEQAKTTPFTELSRDDLRWIIKDSTCVETQSFYFTTPTGYLGLAQVIYSNVAGLRVTSQFNAKIFKPNHYAPHIWSTKPLEHLSFPDDHHSFKADKCTVTLSSDGRSYSVKSTVDPSCIVDLSFDRTTSGFMVGRNGTSTFGTDAQHPWGSMRHAFWPRCRVQGTITTKSDGVIDCGGKGMFVHAFQGMKPHHAAARWNFLSFHGETTSAVMMEFTTPRSYGTTTVNVGGIVTDDTNGEGKIISAGASGTIKHLESKMDTANDWPEPVSFRAEWENGKAVAEGKYGERLDRIDVMAEVPGFVKTIVASAAGTKPFIYQYAPQDVDLVITEENGQTRREKGKWLAEATFISDL